jgi:hypothetical protein
VSDNAPYIVFYVLAAVFVASSLIGRRLPVGQTVKLHWPGSRSSLPQSQSPFS